MKPLILMLSVLALARPAVATTLHVPADYATISAAVTAATAGDTVLVADGTYTALTDTSVTVSQAITVASENGATTTFIDFGSNSGAWYAYADGATVRGFTFRNSQSYSPITVSVSGNVTVEDSTFTQNENNDFGASAIEVQNGTATIARCTFANNSSSSAVELNGANGTISDSVFSQNSSSNGGSAISANTATLTVTGTTFDGNSSTNGYGGAFYLRNGTFTFSGCTFTNNTSIYGGGVAFCAAEGIDTSCSFDHSTVQNNSAPQGGAFFAATSMGSIAFATVDARLIGNSATDDGAVLYVYSDTGSSQSFSATNVTFYGNKVTRSDALQGGVFAGQSAGQVSLQNVILYSDNTPLAFSSINALDSVAVVTSDIADASGTINVDPQFMDPTNGDLRIKSTSPCAFTGTSAGAPADDYAGQSWTGGVSMGAHAAIVLAATTVTVSAPSSVTAGVAFVATVSVFDQFGELFTSYSGTMHFTSSDSAAVLPADTALTAGVGTVSVTLNTSGAQSVTVVDSGNSAINGEAVVNVTLEPLADLTISKSHSGDFTQGQTGDYTLVVTNDGNAATNGVVTVTDQVPTGLTLTTLAGDGWTCDVGSATCGRNDALAVGDSYPQITATFSVASDAAATLTNVATVVGGDEGDITNDSASDATIIHTLAAGLADLTVTLTHLTTFRVGQTDATYTIIIHNSGGQSTSGDVRAATVIPDGLLPHDLSGDGWSCDLGALTCSRTDALAAGASYPEITLIMDVAGGDSPIVATTTVSNGAITSTATDTMDLIDAPAHGCNAPDSGADLTLTIALVGLIVMRRRGAES